MAQAHSKCGRTLQSIGFTLAAATRTRTCVESLDRTGQHDARRKPAAECYAAIQGEMRRIAWQSSAGLARLVRLASWSDDIVCKLQCLRPAEARQQRCTHQLFGGHGRAERNSQATRRPSLKCNLIYLFTQFREVIEYNLIYGDIGGCTLSPNSVDTKWLPSCRLRVAEASANEVPRGRI